MHATDLLIRESISYILAAISIRMGRLTGVLKFRSATLKCKHTQNHGDISCGDMYLNFMSL